MVWGPEMPSQLSPSSLPGYQGGPVRGCGGAVSGNLFTVPQTHHKFAWENQYNGFSMTFLFLVEYKKISRKKWRDKL